MGVAPSLQLMGSERIDLYSWAPGPAVPPYRNEEKRNITKQVIIDMTIYVSPRA